LDKYWDKLKRRQDKGVTPYNLRNCAYLKEFEKEKILYPDIMRLPKNTEHFRDYPYMFLDKNKFYPEATNFIMTGESISLIFAFLTSQLGIYSFVKLYSGPRFDNKGFRYKKIYIGNLPVPKISHKEQKPFINLVDTILAKKEKGKDTTAEENKIDLMVYKLYDLTYEEVKIVDPDIEKIISEKEYNAKSIDNIAKKKTGD